MRASLGQVAVCSTLPRNVLKPSAKTQVPCRRKKSVLKYIYNYFCITSFLTIQSSISLSLSCSSGLQRVTTVLTRSSKSLTCWTGECHRWGELEGRRMATVLNIFTIHGTLGYNRLFRVILAIFRKYLAIRFIRTTFWGK